MSPLSGPRHVVAVVDASPLACTVSASVSAAVPHRDTSTHGHAPGPGIAARTTPTGRTRTLHALKA